MKFSHDKNVKKLVSFIREIICCFCQDKSDIGILGRSIYLAKTIWHMTRPEEGSGINTQCQHKIVSSLFSTWHVTMTYASLLDIISVHWLVFVSLWCSQWSEAVKSLWDLASDPRYNIEYYTGASTLLSHLLLAAMHSISWICLQILNNKENPPSFSDEA